MGYLFYLHFIFYYTFIIANPSGFCLAYLMKNFYYSVTPPDFVEIFQTFPHGFGPEGGGVRRKPRRFRTFSHRKSRRAATPPPPAAIRKRTPAFPA